jgi:hypothetical protein
MTYIVQFQKQSTEWERRRLKGFYLFRQSFSTDPNTLMDGEKVYSYIYVYFHMSVHVVQSRPVYHFLKHYIFDPRRQFSMMLL